MKNLREEYLNIEEHKRCKTVWLSNTKIAYDYSLVLIKWKNLWAPQSDLLRQNSQFWEISTDIGLISSNYK